MESREAHQRTHRSDNWEWPWPVWEKVSVCECIMVSQCLLFPQTADIPPSATLSLGPILHMKAGKISKHVFYLSSLSLSSLLHLWCCTRWSVALLSWISSTEIQFCTWQVESTEILHHLFEVFDILNGAILTSLGRDFTVMQDHKLLTFICKPGFWTAAALNHKNDTN